MLIFLDMDGVLVDFCAAALTLHGKILAPPDRRWDFFAQIGISAEEFWAPMDARWWAGLPWTAEGPLVLRALEDMVGQERITLFTSPCNTFGCLDGKRQWIFQHLPSIYRRRFLMGKDKTAVAGPGKLLIDDNDQNISDFIAAGGSGLLVPRPWNTRHEESDLNGHFSVSRFIEEVQALLFTSSRRGSAP